MSKFRPLLEKLRRRSQRSGGGMQKGISDLLRSGDD